MARTVTSGDSTVQKLLPQSPLSHLHSPSIFPLCSSVVLQHGLWNSNRVYGKTNIGNINICSSVQPSPTLSLYTVIKQDPPLSVLLFEAAQPHRYSCFVVLYIASHLLLKLNKQHVTILTVAHLLLLQFQNQNVQHRKNTGL